MTAEQSQIWARLEAFSFDVGDEALTFAGRLANENGWLPKYAEKVVDEYRKFLFLAVAAGHEVTPSDEVDQAWHLHLTYTRSYWDDLCGRTLNHPLHHGPTKGGEQEDAKYRDWYEKTLASYREFFGRTAPVDVWPNASVRFGEDTHFKRVNTKRYTTKFRPLQSFGTSILLMFLAFAAFVAQIVVPIALKWNPPDSILPGSLELQIGGLIVVLALLGAWAYGSYLKIEKEAKKRGWHHFMTVRTGTGGGCGGGFGGAGDGGDSGGGCGGGGCGGGGCGGD